jgi:hypothetical protein
MLWIGVGSVDVPVDEEPKSHGKRRNSLKLRTRSVKCQKNCLKLRKRCVRCRKSCLKLGKRCVRCRKSCLKCQQLCNALKKLLKTKTTICATVCVCQQTFNTAYLWHILTDCYHSTCIDSQVWSPPAPVISLTQVKGQGQHKHEKHVILNRSS